MKKGPGTGMKCKKKKRLRKPGTEIKAKFPTEPE
jgi:hypothetical protein